MVAGAKLMTDGSYTLLWSAGPDIPVGQYKVSVGPPSPKMPAFYDPGEVVPMNKEYPNIPQEYREHSTTDLTAEVKEGAQALNFNMTD
jgi:hypothetical protein